MKAIVVVAGYATRLYPLTENKPKALLEISGKLMMDRVMEKVESFKKIKEVVVISNNRFYEQFLDWNENYEGSLKIKILNDGTHSNEDRLGALGDIKFAIDREKIDEDVLILGGDNIFEDSLNEMDLNFEKERFPIVAFKDVGNLEVAKCLGIASLDEEGFVEKFVEKPEKPESTLASTFIYIFRKEDLKHIYDCLKENPEKEVKTGEFISYLIEKEKVKGYMVKGNWFDIGNFDQLGEAREYFKKE